jgi:hypothetical protein
LTFERARLLLHSGRAWLLQPGQEHRESFVRTPVIGDDGWTGFHDLAPPGCWLIGFRFVVDDNIRAVNAIYQTAQGPLESRRFYGVEGQTQIVTARPGYAVGGLSVVTGQWERGTCVAGLKVRFMRVNRGALDSNDSYESPWLGQEGRGSEMTVGSTDSLVIGIQGTRSYTQGLLGIGLIHARESGGGE